MLVLGSNDAVQAYAIESSPDHLSLDILQEGITWQ